MLFCFSKQCFTSFCGRPDSSGIHVSVTCSDSAVTPSVQTLLRHNAPSLSLNITKLEKVQPKNIIVK